ncbi:IS3 family transposase [Jeongeupia chitinilytica]|uniref:IS3 family transposase n=1 Tax=Jeongeupia chitinilytica TaxID=1041641 RepID=UPI003570D253
MGERAMGVTRACGLVGVSRSLFRYQPSCSGDHQLRGWLIKLARQRRRFGYRRLHVLLQREGWHVNHKRIW